MSEDKPPLGPARMAQLLLLFIDISLSFPNISDSGVDYILRTFGITYEELELLEKYIGLFRTDKENVDEDDETLYYNDVCPNCAAAELIIGARTGEVFLVCTHCKKEFKRD